MNLNNSAFYILRLLAVKGVGSVKVNTILERARSYQTNIGELFLNLKVMEELLSSQQLEELNFGTSLIKEIWDKLQENDTKLLVINEDEYPRRLHSLLGKKAPPILFVLGNHHILNEPSVGFCGSREASDKGLQAAYECAEQLSERGLNIVSGYAKGVDITTHLAALQTKGMTTLVLPEGIFHFRIKKELENYWDWNKIAVVSEFPPRLSWSVRNAMQRNATICALSQAMILIESKSTGGSIAAGKTSLKMQIPLFAADYAGSPDTAEGNRELVSLGAKPLGRSRKTCKANIGRVLNAIGYENNEINAIETMKFPQLSLF
ncbi:MAG: DNA-protecting protein DprA [Pseudanabaena sp. CAN_BIN31]|nr:DNA-protecting protein DprA [Pseudanabaena sp. CAN_BIN31]